MRHILIIIFACAIGMPAAFATPMRGPHLSRGDRMVQAVKHNPPRNYRHSRSTGGIHPLVGSGNY
jgi:hypothetical protein